jgi:chromate transporter
MTPIPAAVTLAEACRFWFQLGWVSFGGPAGQIALLHRELVERRRWLSERRFLHALNYCMLLPGPEAMQLATYLGWLMHGIPGGLIAGGLFVVPSLLVLTALASVYVIWGQLPLLAALFAALKPAVLAIVVVAAWRIGRRTLRTPLQLGLAVAGFLGLTVVRWPYPLLVGGAALIGLLVCRWQPSWLVAPGPGAPGPALAGPGVPGREVLGREVPAPVLRRPSASRAGAFAAESAPGPASPVGRLPPLDRSAAPAAPTASIEAAGRPTATPATALHGDHTPSPPHARLCLRRLAATLLVWGLALLLPLAGLTASGGWNGTLAQMARFFCRVALLSFGGAYAVLPYVAQGAVERFGWLSTSQMLDGLALGETTPGPLIMVVAFVAFLGGWNQALAAGSPPWSLAIAAVAVTVWFTFLPSFGFILAGGPLVEASRGDLRWSAPLSAITAVVVGVIASLALFFAAPVLWPAGAFSPAAALWVAAALTVQLRLGWSVLQVIAAAAALGAAWAGLAALVF